MSGADDLRDEVAREAAEAQQRRAVAGMLSGTQAIAEPGSRPNGRPRVSGPSKRLGPRSLPDPEGTSRDACFFCGVPGDRHDTSQFACKRWRARP